MPLSLEETAQSLGLSYETYRTRFREIIGVSPLQYRLLAKFHFAQRLLSDGFSVSYTAEKTGYSDQFIFSKQFKNAPDNARLIKKRVNPVKV